MQKITPFLWFENQAEEAANFYVSLFNENKSSSYANSKIISINYYDEAAAQASGMPKGSVLTVAFELAGQQFAALSGGPQFKFSPAISFMIACDTQEEVDYFWERLSDGGEAGQCGWINKDKFGITWQVVPKVLDELLSDPDPEKSKRVMQAMLKMNKIEIDKLKEAAQNY